MTSKPTPPMPALNATYSANRNAMFVSNVEMSSSVGVDIKNLRFSEFGVMALLSSIGCSVKHLVSFVLGFRSPPKVPPCNAQPVMANVGGVGSVHVCSILSGVKDQGHTMSRLKSSLECHCPVSVPPTSEWPYDTITARRQKQRRSDKLDKLALRCSASERIAMTSVSSVVGAAEAICSTSFVFGVAVAMFNRAFYKFNHVVTPLLRMLRIRKPCASYCVRLSLCFTIIVDYEQRKV